MGNLKDNGAALVAQTETGALTKEDINTLAQAGIVPSGTPFSQVMVFAKTCRERGLSPFSKEIYLVNYAGRYSVITGIDGFRRLACETGSYAGCDDAMFDKDSKGNYKTAAELLAANKLPISCTFTVYRMMGGQRVPFTHTAVFHEFSSGKQKWGTMPFQMISKVAEAFALKKGFSDRLTGLHIPEEQAAFENDIAPVTTSNSIDADEIMQQIRDEISKCNSVDELTSLYRKNKQWHGDGEITQLFTERKNELTND